MELFRALGVLIEPPSRSTRRIAEVLELGVPPDSEAHSSLFLFQIYPFASVYLGAEGGLGGEARDRVAGFWRALDETPPAEPDYLPTMLGLYARLVDLEADAAGTDAAAGWRRARHGFLWEHLLSWLFPFLAKVREIGGDFYGAWAEMLEATLAQEAAELGALDALPVGLRDAPGLPDPREGGADAFLTGLLSPVRSGMVFSRSDLARAASDLGLGLRVGERAFILRSMLGQGAESTLDWLRSEASSWVDRHESTGSIVPDISDFWSGRAEASVALLDVLSPTPEVVKQ